MHTTSRPPCTRLIGFFKKPTSKQRPLLIPHAIYLDAASIFHTFYSPIKGPRIINDKIYFTSPHARYAQGLIFKRVRLVNESFHTYATAVPTNYVFDGLINQNKMGFVYTPIQYLLVCKSGNFIF